MLENNRRSQKTSEIKRNLSKDFQVSIFASTKSHIPEDIEIPEFQIIDLWHYKGPVVCTTLDDFETIYKICKKHYRILYLFDTQCLNNGMFYRNYKLLRSADKIVTRSKKYADIIEGYCGIRPIVVKRDFDYNSLIDNNEGSKNG